jgi:hypothetical protein
VLLFLRLFPLFGSALGLKSAFGGFVDRLPRFADSGCPNLNACMPLLFSDLIYCHVWTFTQELAFIKSLEVSRKNVYSGLFLSTSVLFENLNDVLIYSVMTYKIAA